MLGVLSLEIREELACGLLVIMAEEEAAARRSR